jgi:transposase
MSIPIPHENGFHTEYTKRLNTQLPIPHAVNINKIPVKNLEGHLDNFIKIYNNNDQNTYPKINWKFAPTLIPETIKNKPIKNKKPKKTKIDKPSGPMRTLKIRIIPNKLQEQFFKICAEETRIFKNKTYIEINKKIKEAKNAIKIKKQCEFCDLKKELYDKSLRNTQQSKSAFVCNEHKNKRHDYYSDIKIDLKTMRKLVIIKKEATSKKKRFVETVPYATRQLAIKDAITDYKSARSNYLNRNNSHFFLKHINKNSHDSYFNINSDAIKMYEEKNKPPFHIKRNPKKSTQGVVMFKNAISNYIKSIKNTKAINEKLAKVFIQKSAYKKLKNAIEINKGYFNDTKVYQNRGKWFLLASYPITFAKNKKEHSLISIDPGQVIPLAGYRPDDGSCVDIGVDRMNHVEKLKQKIMFYDKLIFNTNKKKKKKSLRKRIGRITYKISCIVNDFHNQTSSWIAKTHEQVLLPALSTWEFQRDSKMTKNVKRKLNSISHFKLREKIKYQCYVNDTKFYVVPENHTSRTCPKCGHWNEQLNGRTHKCGCCGFEGNRDHVGAFNILGKTATEHEVLF